MEQSQSVVSGNVTLKNSGKKSKVKSSSGDKTEPNNSKTQQNEKDANTNTKNNNKKTRKSREKKKKVSRASSL